MKTIEQNRIIFYLSGGTNRQIRTSPELRFMKRKKQSWLEVKEKKKKKQVI